MPSPRQASQTVSGIWPRPWQRGHGRVEVNVPKNELRDSCISPFPLQPEHVMSLEPFFAPEPSQVSHTLVLESSTRRSAPNIDSRKESSISIEMSRPRRVRACPPPNTSLNMSPRSNSTLPPCPPKPWKPWKLEKSQPEAGPPWAENPPPANVLPYVSYSARFFLSESTEYASLTSLNFASLPPFLSGCNLCANFLNADFISSSLAVLEIPKIS